MTERNKIEFEQLLMQITFLGLVNRIEENTIHSLPNYPNFFELRDSLQYRLKSVYYHVSHLSYLTTEYDKLANSEILLEPEYRDHLFAFYEQSHYIFDSIAFQAMSAFDYLGNLVNYFLKIKDTKRLKWSGLIKSANDQNNSFSNCSISKTILSYNLEFVNKLNEYRSDIIHIKMEQGNGSYSIDFNKGGSEIHISPPDKFVHNFAELRKNKDKDISIMFSANWLLQKTVFYISKIIEELHQHAEQEGITVK